MEIFDKHLASLGVGSSRRPTEDWVLDGIFFPWAEKDEHISIPDVINALQEDFQFYGSSPKYLQDSRWFKSVYEDDTGLNKLALEQYDRFVLGLLDCRVTSENLPKIDNQRVADIEGLCKQAHSYYRIINGEESYDKLDEFLSTLQNVVAILPNEMLVTKNSILDFVRGMPHIAEGNLDYSFGEFVDWWGRGEQYVSLIRNDVERF